MVIGIVFVVDVPAAVDAVVVVVVLIVVAVGVVHQCDVFCCG